MYWTYTRVLQSSHASVGLAQAHPNKGTIVASNLHIVEKAKKSRGICTFNCPSYMLMKTSSKCLSGYN